ncbi:MAG: cell wall-associated protease, partial [Dokdonia sp.]
SDSLLLVRAKAAYSFNLKDVNDDLENANMVIESRTNAEAYLKNIFGEQEYTVKDLDSLKKAFPNDTLLQSQALRMSNFITYNFTPERNASRKESLLNFKKFMLNQDYPERTLIGDSVQDKLYSVYGNNQVDAQATFLSHGTLTSGFLTTKYLHQDSINIFENIKIMPLRVSAYGSEYDKDIALAIRYAVDQGAKVINMSFGKRFSMDKHWVDDAIKYAQSKGVLIVKSAGNERFNTDLLENTKYPNDYNDRTEFSNNFITVGGTSYRLNEKLLYYATNYGQETVDVFAPGYGLTGLRPNNQIGANLQGTSSATAIVSGISALLFSYYPELNATDVKKIILESGLAFDHLVNLPKNRGEETVQKPFSQLSKSGKLINAYNAFLLADTYKKR